MPWSFFTSTGKEKVVQETTPVGLIAPYAGSSAPDGWLLCDGSAVNRTTYASLFSAIGEVYGSGNASTTFNLPDMRGRTPVGRYQGYGDRTTTSGHLTGTGAITGGDTISEKTLGAWDGAESIPLSSSQSGTKGHSHTIASSAHNHSISIQDGGAHTHGIGYNYRIFYAGGTTLDQADGGGWYTGTLYDSTLSPDVTPGTSGISINNKTAESGNGHNNMQTSIVVNFIIKT